MGVNEKSFSVKEDNLHIISQEKVSLKEALCELKTSFGCERLTESDLESIKEYFGYDGYFMYKL